MSEELNKEIEKLKKTQKKKNSHYTALEVSLGTMLFAKTAFDLTEDAISYKKFKTKLDEAITNEPEQENKAKIKRANKANNIARIARFGKHFITAATVAVAIHNGIKTMKDVNNIKTGKEISKKIGEAKKKEKENKAK